MKHIKGWPVIIVIIIIAGFSASYFSGEYTQYKDLAGTWEKQSMNDQDIYQYKVAQESELGGPSTLTIKGNGNATLKENLFDLLTTKISYELPKVRDKDKKEHILLVTKSTIKQSIWFDSVKDEFFLQYKNQAEIDDAAKHLTQTIKNLKKDQENIEDIQDEAREHIFAENNLDIVSENKTDFQLTYKFPENQTLYLRVVSKNRIESIHPEDGSVLAVYVRK